jgi:hypothetical protein
MTDVRPPADRVDDALVERLDARLQAVESAAPDSEPGESPANDVAGAPAAPGAPRDASSQDAALDRGVLQELLALLRSVDTRLRDLETVVMPQTSAGGPRGLTAIERSLEGPHNEVGASSATRQADVWPVLTDVQDQLELLRTQLEAAFCEVDVRAAAQAQQLRTLAQAMAVCLDDIHGLRQQVDAWATAGTGPDRSPVVERLENGLHELSATSDDRLRAPRPRAV